MTAQTMTKDMIAAMQVIAQLDRKFIIAAIYNAHNTLLYVVTAPTVFVHAFFL